MKYKIRLANIQDDGNIIEGKRTETIVWPSELRVGGLYALRPNKLYRVVAREAE